LTVNAANASVTHWPLGGKGNVNMRWYCTYCDRNYLVRLLALVSSLTRHETKSFTLYVICLDELTRVLLDHLALPGVVTVPLHDLERGDRQLLTCRSDRSPMEYYWTMTPTVILRLLEWYPHIDALTYLDADLCFFSNPDQMFAEYPDAPAVIHEHRFAQKYKILEQYGRFNVGLMIFRRSKIAINILNWWRSRCIEWCHAHLEAGKFGDQLYLEHWPIDYPGVGVLGHPGAGVAPWNQNDYLFTKSPEGKALVNGQPVIFYHFHSLDIIAPGLYRPSKLLHYWFELPVLSLCYMPYVSSLQEQICILQNLLPDFDCGFRPQETPLSHTLLADIPTARVLGHYMTNLQRVNLGDNWTCCSLPIPPPDPAKLAELSA
jgi:hypothetical protein